MQQQAQQTESEMLQIESIQDAIDFVGRNTYINGESLQDLYPEIQQQLASQQQQLTDSLSERLVKTSPQTLKRVMKRQQSSESSSDAEEAEEEAEEAEEEAEEMTFNFDDEVINAFLNDQSATVEELLQAKDTQTAIEKQTAIAEAAEGLKSAIDEMVEDMEENQAPGQEAQMADLEAKVASWKASIDEQAQVNIDKIEALLAE